MTRRLSQVLAILFAVLAVMLMLGACYRIGAARAAATVTTDGATTPVVLAQPATGLPWEAWAALAIAALGSLRGIVHGLRELFGLFSKRTKTTVDDSIEGALAAADDALSSALGTVRGLAGKAGPTVVLLLVGASLTLQPACSSWRARSSAAAGAFIDCESPHVDAALLADATSLAKVAVMAAISGDGHADAAQLKADAAPLKSDLLRCGFAAAIAALAAPVPAQPGAPAAAGMEVDGPQLRSAFRGARAELGWAPVKLPDGAVL